MDELFGLQYLVQTWLVDKIEVWNSDVFIYKIINKNQCESKENLYTDMNKRKRKKSDCENN